MQCSAVQCWLAREAGGVRAAQLEAQARLAMHSHSPGLPCPARCPLRPATLPPLQCVQSCCTKFMKHSARMGLRFGELSSEAESQMQQMMQQGGGK